MSIMIIPADLYIRYWQDEVATGLRRGKTPAEAKARATELMANAFMMDDHMAQYEFEKDIADDRLSIGT